MAHKLSGSWSCFYLKFQNDKKHTLQRVGDMHLSFKPDGELESAELVLTGGSKEKLEGSANSGFGELYMELESENYGYFEGVLTYESDTGASLAVTGKWHMAQSDAIKKLVGPSIEGQKDQTDPPWIITKP